MLNANVHLPLFCLMLIGGADAIHCKKKKEKKRKNKAQRIKSRRNKRKTRR